MSTSDLTAKKRIERKGLGPIQRLQLWWPVEARLPYADIQVCVCTRSGTLFEAYLGDDDRWFDESGIEYDGMPGEEIGWWADMTSPMDGGAK